MPILQPVAAPPIVGRPIKMAPVTPKVHELRELEQTAVHPRVVAALRAISRRLSEQHVRHCVLGAIAVGIHGWPRATQDVDLLSARSVGPSTRRHAHTSRRAPRSD